MEVFIITFIVMGVLAVIAAPFIRAKQRHDAAQPDRSNGPRWG